MTRAYLDSFDFVSHIQLANLDAPENRDIVQDALEEIKSNVQGEFARSQRKPGIAVVSAPWVARLTTPSSHQLGP
jgi:hypothetical protein